jgi:hypothetical protein
MYKYTGTTMRGEYFGKRLVRDVNLRRILFVPGSLVAITAIIVAGA